MNQTQLARMHFNRAADCFRCACHAQAIRHYLDGLKLDSTQVEIYADLSKAYEMVGLWDNALECLEVALQLRSDYAVALRRRGRILEEKQVYEALIRERQLDPALPDDFLVTRSDANDVTASTIKREHFVLTYDNTIPSRTLWYLCQFIEQTYHEVGELLQCYPQRTVSIVLEDIERRDKAENQINAPATSASSLPRWAAAEYDGHIRLTCSTYGDPDLGVLLALTRHEWVHLLVDILIHQQYPVWFNEGLAQIVARPLMDFERQALQDANRKRQLLCAHELGKPFSDMLSDQRRIAYLQSTAIMEYLIQKFGISRIRDLLHCIDNGASTKVAFHQVFGETEEGIVEEWQERINCGKTRYCNHRAGDLGRSEVFSRRLYA